MTLSETIMACAPQLATGQKLFVLLYSPACCRFALINCNGETIETIIADRRGGEINLHEVDKAANDTQTSGEGFNLGSVFEARLFNAQADVRWLHAREGRGEAAAVAETSKLKLFGIEEPSGQECATPPIKQTYMLWGAGSGDSTEKWSEMTTARTGAFLVPVPHLARQERVQFNSVEYVKSYRDGNLGVFEERLTGLTKCETRNTAAA